ncbi:hypothetical protein BGW39_006371 [Mortierella sp. 14UC]|nr:hypothetical protein BGW39_006371 [Mortierella sp. 14UC]
MIFPKPLPPSPSITSDQLFSLPRISYFYSITPYPLSVATNAPSGMKRRYNFDNNSDNSNNNPDEPSSASNRGYEGSNGVGSAQQGQGLQGSQHDSSEGAGADDGFDHLGIDMIEGRVLKKMRHIKLTSESPPADQPDMFAPQMDPHTLNSAIWNANRDGPSTSATSTPQDLSNLAIPSDLPRPFAPIKISTRSSSSRQESVVSSSSSSSSLSTNPTFRGRQEEQAKADDTTQFRAAGDGTADMAVYVGMNSLLHQIHASRFGIPDEVESPAVEATSTPVQDSYQDFGVHSAWHRHQQQQQQHTGNVATNAAWYQPQQRNTLPSTQLMDEDDEMSDVSETQSFSPSFPANGFRSPQGIGGNLVAQQGYVLNQHLAHQQQQLAQQQQSLQQSQGGQTAEEQNLYHTINSQLRAAFLARSEMDKRYR